MPRYRLKNPISAMYDKPGGGYRPVTLPGGAILTASSQRSTALLGMVGVYWEERPYLVRPNDLLENAERVQSA